MSELSTQKPAYLSPSSRFLATESVQGLLEGPFLKLIKSSALQETKIVNSVSRLSTQMLAVPAAFLSWLEEKELSALADSGTQFKNSTETW